MPNNWKDFFKNWFKRENKAEENKSDNILPEPIITDLLETNEFGFSSKYFQDSIKTTETSEEIQPEEEGNLGFSKKYSSSKEDIDIDSYKERKPRRVTIRGNILSD